MLRNAQNAVSSRFKRSLKQQLVQWNADCCNRFQLFCFIETYLFNKRACNMFFYVWRAYVSDYISRCTLYNIMHSKRFLVWISYLVIHLLLNYCNALVWNGRFIMSMWISEKRLVWSKQHAHHTQSLNNLSTFYFLLFIRIFTTSKAVISKAHSNFECVC